MIKLHAPSLITIWNKNAMYPQVFTMRGLSSTSGGPVGSANRCTQFFPCGTGVKSSPIPWFSRCVGNTMCNELWNRSEASHRESETWEGFQLSTAIKEYKQIKKEISCVSLLWDKHQLQTMYLLKTTIKDLYTMSYGHLYSIDVLSF